MTATDERVAERRIDNKNLRTERAKGPFKCQRCAAVNGKKKRGGGVHRIVVYVSAKTNKQEIRCLKHL